MVLKNIKQINQTQVDPNISLRKPPVEEWEVAHTWYSDKDVRYYSEGISNGKKYNIDTVNKMYGYLGKIVELYFIEIYDKDQWKTICDVTLAIDDLPIVIGEKVIAAIIERARQLDLKKLKVDCIYKYNFKSKRLFESLGFSVVSETAKGYSLELQL